MKQIKLYLRDDFNNCLQDWKEIKPFKTLSVADDIELWDKALVLDDKYYTVCMSEGNNYKIDELPNFDLSEEETSLESEIKCPICGYEVSDSWEYSDDEGELVCDGCGATLEWGREVEVTYSTKVTEKTEPIKL